MIDNLNDPFLLEESTSDLQDMLKYALPGAHGNFGGHIVDYYQEIVFDIEAILTERKLAEALQHD